MELLFYILLILFVIFLNIALYLPSYFSVSEEDVTENIRLLRRQAWFQQLLQYDPYHALIVHDSEVRRTIGKFNKKRLEISFYQRRYEKRLHRIFAKKA